MTTQEGQLTWAAKRARIANSVEANERHRRREPPIIDWDEAITNLLDFLDGTYLAAPPPLFRRRMSGNDYSGAVQRCLSADRIGARDESLAPRLGEMAAGLAKGVLVGRPISLPALVIESLPDLTGAACAGRSDLFDLKAGSLRHRTALAMCARCTVLAACRAWFASLPAAQRPFGVVAGSVHRPANEKCTPTA
jgi:hypothetical protein